MRSVTIFLCGAGAGLALISLAGAYNKLPAAFDNKGAE